MVRRSLYLLALFISIQVLLYSCIYTCKDISTTFYNVNYLEANNFNIDSSSIITDTTILASSFMLTVELENEMISSYLNPKYIINGAYALSCFEPLELQNKISSIEISCNQNIFNTNANEPINQSNFNIYINTINEAPMDINTWLVMLNSDNGNFMDQFYISFVNGITSNESLSFTFSFTLSDGSIISNTSPPIKIIQ